MPGKKKNQLTLFCFQNAVSCLTSPPARARDPASPTDYRYIAAEPSDPSAPNDVEPAIISHIPETERETRSACRAPSPENRSPNRSPAASNSRFEPPSYNEEMPEEQPPSYQEVMKGGYVELSTVCDTLGPPEKKSDSGCTSSEQII